VTAVAVHVVNNDVVSASNSNAVILVEDNRVANLGVVAGTQIEPITVMRSRQAIGSLVGCVSSTVVQRDVVNVESSAVTDAEAMNRVVLYVEVVDRAGSEDLPNLNEVIRLRKTPVTTQTIPPALAVAVENGTFCSCDLDVGASNLDKCVVGIGVLPESLALEGQFGPFLQL
jgi:hypothetical protein